MIKVYLVAEKELDKLRAVVGAEGSTLNPVQDADGNWFISPEEVNSKEFAKFFNQDEVQLKAALVETEYKRPDYKLNPLEFIKPTKSTDIK